MADADKHYPNLTWPQFAMCNDDATGAFEDMSRRLFSQEFLGNGTVPHSDHNNPGVEVLPILEQPREDGSKQRKISFQAKTVIWEYLSPRPIHPMKLQPSQAQP